MSKQAKTPYAILGLLTLSPMSGYEMKSFYDRSLRFFWNESFGQIYPALKQLESEGLVWGSDEPSARGKPRRRYSITEAGRVALKGWMEMAVEESPVRSELLLKVFFGAAVDTKTIERHLRSQQVKAEERLAVYKVIEAGIRADNPDPRSRTMHLMTLEYGKRQVEMVAGWCRHGLEELEKLTGEQPSVEEGRRT